MITLRAFADCHSDGGSGSRQAALKLWKVDFGPDENRGSRTNKCNTSSWGDQPKDDYYFELDSSTAASPRSLTMLRGDTAAD
ncbi:hypothetical protein [Streptomyces sp. SYSU K217416]